MSDRSLTSDPIREVWTHRVDKRLFGDDPRIIELQTRVAALDLEAQGRIIDAARAAGVQRLTSGMACEAELIVVAALVTLMELDQ